MHRESNREAENPGRRPPITHRSDRFRHGFSPLLKFLSPDASPLLTAGRTSHEPLGSVHSFPSGIGRTKANRWIDRRFISMEDFGQSKIHVRTDGGREKRRARGGGRGLFRKSRVHETRTGGSEGAARGRDLERASAYWRSSGTISRWCRHKSRHHVHVARPHSTPPH